MSEPAIRMSYIWRIPTTIMILRFLIPFISAGIFIDHRVSHAGSNISFLSFLIIYFTLGILTLFLKDSSSIKFYWISMIYIYIYHVMKIINMVIFKYKKLLLLLLSSSFDKNAILILKLNILLTSSYFHLNNVRKIHYL